MSGENGGGAVDINAIIAQAMANSPAKSTAAQDPPVFWGGFATYTGGRDTSARDELGITNGGDKVLTSTQAKSDFYQWSDAERAAWGKRLYNLGVIKDPTDFQGMQSAWNAAVEQASNFYSVAGKKVTPWQVVDILAGNGGGGRGPTTTTSTSKSFNIPTLEDAKAAASSVTQTLLGRDPDENEQHRLASILTGYAQAHPSVTKATQTTDGKGNTSSTSTSSGDYTAAGMQQVLKDKVQADPEYGAYQASTTYFDAMMRAIGGGEH